MQSIVLRLMIAIATVALAAGFDPGKPANAQTMQDQMRDRERMRENQLRDTATGILGGMLIERLTRPEEVGDGTQKNLRGNKKKEPVKRARKGGPDEKKKDAPVVAKPKEEAPTPVAGDPADGIPIPGEGVVRRGTGTYDGGPNDKRPAIYCWFVRDPKSPCKEYRTYQIVKPELWIDWLDGKGLQDVTAEVNKIKGFEKGIKSATGATIKFGEWNADDYGDRIGNKEKIVVDPKTNQTIEVGPYRQVPIPGVPGAKGLVDAPSWEKFSPKIYKGLLPKEVEKKIPPPVTAVDPPADAPLGTMEFRQRFQTYLYCHKPKSKCLGYFEWSYVEHVTITLTWVGEGEKSDMFDKSGAKPKMKWTALAKFVAKSDPPKVGPWKACP